MTTAPILQIRLLGAFGVAVGGRAVPERAWRARKARQVVALLALAPGQRLTLDELWDTLWPDLAPEAARHACHQALYLARRALDPDKLGLLTVRQNSITLAAPGGVVVDVATFRAAARDAMAAGTVAAYEAALACYAGVLLPDDRYEDWAATPREVAQREYVDLLLALARRHEAARDGDAASQVFERACEADPANEEAHVGVMRAHALAGRRAQALAHYRLLRDALRRELDAEPEPATQRLYAALLAGQTPGPVASPAATEGGRRERAHNLPAQVTPLFGRAADLAAVRAAVRAERLVTLTGSGGCGKTRLAIAAADGLVGDFAAGVWLVDLTPLADGALVPATVARVFDVREQAGSDLTEALAAALRERAVLLVLDNCEHLAGACAALVTTLLTRCPALRVLATSRGALRVAGEVVWRVPSLPVPREESARGEGDVLAAVADNPAAQLFVARARLVQPGLAVTAQTAPALARICRQLDGLPLALELAAARTAVLTVGQLAARLGQVLRILTAGERTAPARQQTLRATLDWSYQLLEAAGQTLLARLSVFAGGWTLEAAEAVCGDASGAGDVLDGLAALVEQSLVQVEVPTGDETEVRYRLLETVRQYAAEHLVTLGEAEGIRERHAAYYRTLALETAPILLRPQREAALARFEEELDNLRGALAWWAGRGAAEQGLRLAAALSLFWMSRDHQREGLHWLTEAFASSAATAPPLARGLALSHAGVIATALLDAEVALPLLTGGIALIREADARGELAIALTSLGNVLRMRDDHAGAQTAWQEARSLFEGLGHAVGAATAASNMITLFVDREDYAAAEPLTAEVLARCRQANLTYILPLALGNRGFVLAALGQVGPGIALLQESIRLFQAQSQWTLLAHQMVGVGWLLGQCGRHDAAGCFLGAAAAAHARLRLTLPATDERRLITPTAAAARAALGEAGYAAAYATGAGWSLEETTDRALADLATLAPAPSDEPAA